VKKRIRKKKRKPCEKCGTLDQLKVFSGLELCFHCYEIDVNSEYDYGD